MSCWMSPIWLSAYLHLDLAAALLRHDLGEFLHPFVEIAVGDERRTEA